MITIVFFAKVKLYSKPQYDSRNLMSPFAVVAAVVAENVSFSGLSGKLLFLIFLVSCWCYPVGPQQTLISMESKENHSIPKLNIPKFIFNHLILFLLT